MRSGAADHACALLFAPLVEQITGARAARSFRSTSMKQRLEDRQRFSNARIELGPRHRLSVAKTVRNCSSPLHFVIPLQSLIQLRELEHRDVQIFEVRILSAEQVVDQALNHKEPAGGKEVGTARIEADQRRSPIDHRDDVPDELCSLPADQRDRVELSMYRLEIFAGSER